MAEGARERPGRPAHGSVAEEAVKLAEVAQLWLAARGAGAARDVWADATAEPAESSEPCSGCPVCRVRRTLGSVSPEVYGHLGDAAASLAAALRALGSDREPPS